MSEPPASSGHGMKLHTKILLGLAVGLALGIGVNVTVGTPGCSTIAAPASRPVPCTILSTPPGTPASAASAASIAAVVGVTSLGLPTTVFPVASAGAIFHVNRYSGRFHGEMHPATPRGRLSV